METRKEPKYKYNPLRGHMALAACGVPAEFASRCMFVLIKYQLTAAWRVGDTNEIDPDAMSSTTKKRLTIDHPAYPKPPDVKEKSSNWGFTKWFLADDPILGKYDQDNVPVNIGIKRSSRVEAMPHFVTLRFIMNCMNKQPATMRLISCNDGALMIECLDAPKGAPNIFRIKLEQSKSPNQVDPTSFMVAPDSAHNKPEWWPNQHLFGAMLDRRFPVEVKKSSVDDFEPVNVLGIRDKETKELVPIITDMDLLWLSTPGDDIPMVQIANIRKINLFDVLNTYNKRDLEKLKTILNQLVAIDYEIYKDNPENMDHLDLKSISDETFANMGCVTPFIAYFILVVNQHFGIDIEHLQDLMQHAPEIFNPNKPSALGTTLNITRGEIIETLCEEDQILYALELIEDGYQIPPHPKWEMSKWGIVVERSIEKGHAISPEVLAAYNTFKDQEAQSIHSSPVAFFHSFARRTSQPLLLLFRKKSSAPSPIIPQRKDSAGIFIVQIHCQEIDVNHLKSSLIESKKQLMLANLCREESSDTIKWIQHNKQLLAIVFDDGKNTFNLCEFRIDANRISLISGEVNDTSLSVLKKLSDYLFDQKPFIIYANNSENKDKAENVLLPPKSPRPN